MSQYALEVLRAEASTTTATPRPPVMFVHGSACGAWVWQERFMPYFAQRGYSSVAPSFRGHGGSEGRKELHQFGVEDYAADVEQVARSLKAPPIVIAHSLGAKVVEHVARKVALDSVVLLAPVSPFGLVSSTLSLAFGAPVLLSQLWWAQALGGGIDLDVVGKALFSEQLDPQLRTRYSGSFQLESSRVALELTAQSYWPHSPQRLPRSLVIGGDRDLLVPRYELGRTAHAYGSSLEVLKGVNHLLMLDTCWREVADRTLAFLEAKPLAVAA
jgi:pimeloyl-ACP methyl ester carboxylesterase